MDNTLEQLIQFVENISEDAANAHYMETMEEEDDEQDDWLGVQFVSMNVGLLLDYLAENDQCMDDLPKSSRRKIWEKSPFHYGTLGYEPRDADYYWEHQEN